MFLNSMPRLDVLSDDDLATLDAGWERLAAEVGVRFDHPRALELFHAAGQRGTTPAARRTAGSRWWRATSSRTSTRPSRRSWSSS
jgi:hypothetical protein